MSEKKKNRELKSKLTSELNERISEMPFPLLLSTWLRYKYDPHWEMEYDLRNYVDGLIKFMDEPELQRLEKSLSSGERFAYAEPSRNDQNARQVGVLNELLQMKI